VHEKKAPTKKISNLGFTFSDRLRIYQQKVVHSEGPNTDPVDEEYELVAVGLPFQRMKRGTTDYDKRRQRAMGSHRV